MQKADCASIVSQVKSNNDCFVKRYTKTTFQAGKGYGIEHNYHILFDKKTIYFRSYHIFEE